MSIAAAIISAIVAGGTSIAGGIMQNKSQEEAQGEARKLSEQARQDQLRMNAQTIAMQKEQFEYGKQQDALNRQEKQEETAYNRKQQAFTNALSILNSNRTITQNLGQYWGGK